MRQDIAVEIRGIVPLLMARYQGEKLPVQKPKNKTQEWIDKMHRTDWEERAYFDPERGFHIPPEMIEAMLSGAAKKRRQGTLFREAVGVVEDFIPLIVYSSQSDSKGKHLKGELREFYRPEYIDLRGVGMKGSGGRAVRVDRCRPIFRYWGLKFTIRYDTASLEAPDVRQALERGQIGDFRPRFGRFDIVRFEPMEAAAAA